MWHSKVTDYNVVDATPFGRDVIQELRDACRRQGQAALFSTVEGYWEAIPTTNESYGYNKFDKSHKSPAELIELLARAASKGGNVMLNVGPMGTGQFSPEDRKGLEGIGQWWRARPGQELMHFIDVTLTPIT